MKDRIVYRETYKKGTTLWEGVNFPQLPTIKPGLDVTKVDLLAQGTMQIEGDEVHFQDVRIFVVPR
ncbi:MAG TPA: hypothetical protein VGL34_24920 [Steroidobacteraceae bacterium]|jgi:hypothetical protein